MAVLEINDWDDSVTSCLCPERNKSQGQTLDGLLLDATVPPFEHGHSYGALAPLYGVSSRRRLA